MAVALVVLAAATGGGWSVADRFGLWGQLGARTSVPPAPPAVPHAQPALGARWLSVGLVAAVAALAIVLLWRSRPGRAWRRRRYPAQGAPDLLVAVDDRAEAAVGTLRSGLTEALRLIGQGSDPTDAIVAAWLALEEAAALIGARRGPADTPTEFTVAVLAQTPADRIAVGALLQLYHRARFSASGVGAGDLERARRCLQDLADSWYRFDASWSPAKQD